MRKILGLMLLVSIFTIGCGEKKDHEDNYNLNEEGPINADTTAANNMVREGVIDVASIDKNNDNNVYQCPMDWNVISDESGNCPVCKMNLEQYSIAEARDNLVKNDYEVTE